jgi:TusA-related sulfurtransferase
MPIVETSKAIKQIEVGQVLKVIATDAGSEADIPAWASQTGHKLIDSSRAGNQFIFHILRSK